MIGFKKKSKAAAEQHRQRTAVSFNREDLAALARLVAAGKLMLQTTHPGVSRLKAALTRIGVPIPQGL